MSFLDVGTMFTSFQNLNVIERHPRHILLEIELAQEVVALEARG